jgi:hypothetical protein
MLLMRIPVSPENSSQFTSPGLLDKHFFFSFSMPPNLALIDCKRVGSGSYLAKKTPKLAISLEVGLSSYMGEAKLAMF